MKHTKSPCLWLLASVMLLGNMYMARAEGDKKSPAAVEQALPVTTPPTPIKTNSAIRLCSADEMMNTRREAERLVYDFSDHQKGYEAAYEKIRQSLGFCGVEKNSDKDREVALLLATDGMLTGMKRGQQFAPLCAEDVEDDPLVKIFAGTLPLSTASKTDQEIYSKLTPFARDWVSNALALCGRYCKGGKTNNICGRQQVKMHRLGLLPETASNMKDLWKDQLPLENAMTVVKREPIPEEIDPKQLPPPPQIFLHEMINIRGKQRQALDIPFVFDVCPVKTQLSALQDVSAKAPEGSSYCLSFKLVSKLASCPSLTRLHYKAVGDGKYQQEEQVVNVPETSVLNDKNYCCGPFIIETTAGKLRLRSDGAIAPCAARDNNKDKADLKYKYIEETYEWDSSKKPEAGQMPTVKLLRNDSFVLPR
ncbi:MAG: hypothetical protein ACOYK8_05485 [Alphaproteobacteria bacterium]